MTDTSARRLNAEEREERRKRFLVLRAWFKMQRPREKWARLIAEQEDVSEKLVYDVISGRR